MNRLAVLLYGVLAHALFFAVFAYLIGFLSNTWVTKSIDSGEGKDFGTALVVNLVLLSLFAVSHSVMARPAFKEWWTRFVPKPLERSTYVMVSNFFMALFFWQWIPMPDLIWEIEGSAGATVMWGLFSLGWVVLVISTLLIDHFDLFGTRQVVLYFLKKPYTPPEFQSRLFYNLIRHPLMLGWLIAFWATPHMTVGHLVFSLTTTVYILIAIQIEERDLMRFHGESYGEYRRRVPMLLPFFKRGT